MEKKNQERKVRIYGFGEAPEAAKLGYSIRQVVVGTEEEIKTQFSGDVIAVKGASIFGREGANEWAIMTPTERKVAEHPDCDSLCEACPKCGSYFGSTCRCDDPVELPLSAFTKFDPKEGKVGQDQESPSPEFYVWCEGSCDNKTNNPAEALRWMTEYRADGRDDVYVVDVDNILISETELRARSREEAELKSRKVVQNDDCEDTAVNDYMAAVANIEDSWRFRGVFFEVVTRLKESFSLLHDKDVVNDLALIVKDQVGNSGESRVDHEAIRKLVVTQLSADPSIVLDDIRDSVRRIKSGGHAKVAAIGTQPSVSTAATSLLETLDAVLDMDGDLRSFDLSGVLVARENLRTALCPNIQTAEPMKATQFVKKFYSESTGGGCMVDFFELNDGRIIGLNDECIVLYPSSKAVYEGDENGDFNFRTIRRKTNAPTRIQHPRLGTYTDSVHEEYTVDLFLLDTEEVLGIDGKTICLYRSLSDVFEATSDCVIGSIVLSETSLK